MFTPLFYIILIIIVVDFLLERYLERLNILHSGKELPALLKGIFDEQKYSQQQAYLKVNYRFGFWSSGFNFLILLLMLFLSGFAWVNNITASLSSNPVWWALLFFGLIMLTAGILNLPWSVYDTFIIEQKFGFNKTTPRTFIFDLIKSLLLAVIVGGGLMALIIWIYGKTESYFWLLAWGIVTLFSLFMAMFYSNLIVPLFNKQIPLPEGELRSTIQDFAQKVGFKLDNIFIINGSKRSSKGNAYFSGLGPKKRIVLYDTLIEELTVNELVAVLAHEIGHFKKKHVLIGLVIGLFQTGVLLFLFSLFVKNRLLSMALGVTEPNFHIGMVAFGLLYSPVSLVTGLMVNMMSRRNEFIADQFAAENYDPAALSSALKKLSVQNLSNMTPHPLYVFFHYSHPPLLARLESLKKKTRNT
jgi:STE24 endopeptidase